MAIMSNMNKYLVFGVLCVQLCIILIFFLSIIEIEINKDLFYMTAHCAEIFRRHLRTRKKRRERKEQVNL